ncbi:hypothetical protein [Agrobacterium sp. P15N1-A]|uniref:hypothetical protein n=1 Tax=Agrobacterium sp. P15N1-A TaxID=3342820 RepID=UPI0037D70508
MFQVERDTMRVLNALVRSYSDVAFAILTAVRQGRTATATEEEAGGMGYVPFSLDEQLELCRAYIQMFIETPCRAALRLQRLGKEYEGRIEFSRGSQEPLVFVPPVDGAEAALDTFLTTVNAYIDNLMPQPPSSTPATGSII